MNRQDTQDITTVLCLFHSRQQAQQALSDLQRSDVPAHAISVIDGQGSSSATTGQTVSALQQLQLPEHDLQLLSHGLKTGGAVIVVSGPEAYTDVAEDIFGRHRAGQVDEKVIADKRPVQAGTEANVCSNGVIPIVQEELQVGKRRVQRGGVRVYSHVVERPVEEPVVLQEEHAFVNRHAVNRPVTEADLARLKDQSMEVTEMAEVPVVEKSARVVEEVLVSKEAVQHTEHVADTVRRTEVEVEPIDASTPAPKDNVRKVCS
jgi:uncharacterized protein (TIGR02271 family)